jgi:hypothetical protein
MFHRADPVRRTTGDNLKQRAPSIELALKQVRAATSTLASTLRQGCPGSSATPS